MTFYSAVAVCCLSALLGSWLKRAASGSWPVIEVVDAAEICLSVVVSLGLPFALGRRRVSLLRGLRIARTVVFNEQIQQGLAVGGVISGVIFAGAGAGPAHIHALPFAARHDFGAGP